MAAYVCCHRGCVWSLRYMISHWQPEHDGGCVAWVYTSGTICGCTFLWARGLSTEEVHHEMHPVYGDNCFSQKTVFNWIQEFNKGRQSIRDEERPGRPAEVSTEATEQCVEEIIRNDRHVSIDDVVRAIGFRHGTTYNIMHEQLQFRKVCAWWVPCCLTEEQKCSEWVCPCITLISTLRKERTSWHELLRKTSLGCTTFNQNRKDLPWNGNVPLHQQKKSWRRFHQPTRLFSPCFGTCKGSYYRNSSLMVRMWMLHHTAPLCRNSDRLFAASDLDSWQREWFSWMTMPALTQQE